MKILQSIQIPQYFIVILITVLQTGLFGQTSRQALVTFEIPGTFDPFAIRYAAELQSLCEENNLQLIVRNFEHKTKTDTLFTRKISEKSIIYQSNLDSFQVTKPINKRTAKKLYRFGINLMEWYDKQHFDFQVPDYYLKIEGKPTVSFTGKANLPNSKQLNLLFQNH